MASIQPIADAGEAADGRALFVYQHLRKGDNLVTRRRDIALFDSCQLRASGTLAGPHKALPSFCTLSQLPVDKSQWNNSGELRGAGGGGRGGETCICRQSHAEQGRLKELGRFKIFFVRQVQLEEINVKKKKKKKKKQVVLF